MLPTYISVGYEMVPVWAYIPNPVQCFRCQRFWHNQQCYTSSIVCDHCSESSHSDTTCPNALHCVNCGSIHPWVNKNCPFSLMRRTYRNWG